MNDKSSFAKYKECEIVNNYKKIMMDMFHINFPLLSETELSSAIDFSISKHLKNTDVRINNNYKNMDLDTTLIDLSDYIINKQPIITSYGVLFSRHGTVPNPIYKMLDGFINGRKAMKKEMFKYPKGSEEFEKYNLLQLLLKIDSNGLI